ncbi:Glu-tRNA(Gln) amidotransferase subunit GatE [Candidatus Thorarchaeota archaeon]|nr:MAG: Glu-tRNA(Gln) amidotransferase subunit GatE [Candidatus Thorarchaeota archaeon]
MTDPLNFEELGLKVGLELHQQLDTSRKLFCHCPTVIRDDKPDGGFLRRLRPTQSELGEIDPAALFEFQRKKLFYYEYYNSTTCLVEADEEPPHEIDDESIDICLMMARFLDSSVMDEIHPMRKIVIDGSNTTGFQRTAVIATDGKIVVNGKPIGIQTICLEEDAARKIEDDETKNMRTYRLDRLGIPLIEIATAPDISTPKEAHEVAFSLGLLLRSTRKVKRGLGSIRQDVNVSITGGAITEIKGLQQLEMLDSIVENEALRQKNLLEIARHLQELGITSEEIQETVNDVSAVFQETESKIIKVALKRDNGVYAIRLQGFAGLLGRELQPGRRLGTEFSDYAKFWGGVGGIFHTDELPGYGISAEEVKRLRKSLSAKSQDAVVLVVGDAESSRDALTAVLKRAKVAIDSIPAETRTPLPNGTTRYARPRPGAERMYPETDVRPVKITASRLKSIASQMPESLEAKEKRFVEELGLSEELASLTVRSLNLELFETLVEETDVSPTLVAVTLENTLVSLHREGLPVENISEEMILRVFRAVEDEAVSAEALPELLSYLAEHPEDNLDEAITVLELELAADEDIHDVIQRIVESRTDFILEQGKHSIGGLMGVAMSELKGKVDGKRVKELLEQAVHQVLESKEASE